MISNETVIDLNTLDMPSDILFQFQNLLYSLSLKPNQVSLEIIETFLDSLLDVLNKQQLITNGYKTVAFQLLQLALLIGALIIFIYLFEYLN